MLKSVSGLLFSVLLSGCSIVGIRSGTEEPRHEIIGRIDDTTEIRRYAPRIAAEVEVPTSAEDDGRSAAFRILADYIFGNNRGHQKIDMTAPVETKSGSVKIAMTAPVETKASSADSMVMRFTIPAAWTRETLPDPVDARVRIVEVPGTTLAVTGFTGARDPETLQARQTELLHRLDGSGWKAVGQPFSMLYDPPWTLAFLRRNEVAVEVAQK